MAQAYRVSANKLQEYCKDIFIGFGVDEKDAVTVAGSLVDADLRNVTTHGVVRVSNYIGRLKNGGTVAKPQVLVEKETPVSALIDAGNGLGSIASQRAVDLLIEKASQSGMAAVAVKNSNHYGAAAYWSLQMAEKGLVGISCSNVEPLVAATGGKGKVIGNNPISFAFPTESYGAVCYDIACSKMAGGNIFKYKLLGKSLPEGCFLDGDGSPTTDPEKASILLPFGGHKGYGLAVVVEMLTSILAGEMFGSNMGSQYGILNKPNLVSHFFLAFKVDMFRQVDEYKQEADKFVNYLRSSPTAEGVDHVLYPGELESKSKAAKLSEGLVLQGALVDELKGFAREAGVPQSQDALLDADPID